MPPTAAKISSEEPILTAEDSRRTVWIGRMLKGPYRALEFQRFKIWKNISRNG